eukprot:3767832-Rhodomonas_salina.4
MPFDGQFPTDPILPRPAVGNGLALGYYSLSNLPASTAVQFAKRETNFAGGVLRSKPPAQTTVDEAAAAAYRSGTRVVVDRRERDGNLPRPLPRSNAVEPQAAERHQASVSTLGGGTPAAAAAAAEAAAATVGDVGSERDVGGMERELAVAQNQVRDLEKRVLKLEAAKQQPSP